MSKFTLSFAVDGGGFLFELSDGWALGCDRLQWMVMSARNRRGEREWQPVSFIVSTKEILLRCIRENGCIPTPEGQAELNALPNTFSKWLTDKGGEQAANPIPHNKRRCAAFRGVPSKDQSEEAA